jgi:membrane associated rhomboid family serine protease
VTAAAWVVTALFAATIDWYAIAGFIPGTIGGEVTVVGALPVAITPLSSALLHSGFAHLFLNMIMLLWCGRQVETALGWKLYLLLYVVGAYAAAAAQWALDPASGTAMVGASGAISAVVGMYALVFGEQRVPAIGPIPGHIVRALWLAAAWIGLQALIGIGFSGGIGGNAGVAIGAHIGGFLAGLLLARPLLRWRYR